VQAREELEDARRQTETLSANNGSNGTNGSNAERNGSNAERSGGGQRGGLQEG